MHVAVKRTLTAVIVVFVTLILVVGGYVVYVVTNYERLGNVALTAGGTNPATSLQAGQEYQALTWNIGFGAYGQDYSFFMDKSVLRRGVAGVGDAGDSVSGTAATAKSKENALWMTHGVVDSIADLSRDKSIDFLLLQEVDTDSHRSFRVDQVDMIISARAEENPQSVFANNFHSVWLQYPVLNPIGDIQSGLLTTSRFTIDSADRYSYTIVA